MSEPTERELVPVPGQGLGWEGHEAVPSQCALCERFNRSEEFPGVYCRAFPGGIPAEVLRNLVDHRRPLEYDGGTQFAPDPEADPRAVARLHAALDLVDA